MWLNAEIFVWKFFASTSFGTCAVQSVSWKVESSLNDPSLNTYR